MSKRQSLRLSVVSWAAVSLWGVVLALIVYLSVQTLRAEGHAASVLADAAGLVPVPDVDLSNAKSVVTLALSVATAAIALSGYLVRQLMAIQRDSINSINKMSEELTRRPCALQHDHRNP